MSEECRHNRDAFSEYVDGELDGPARRELDAHLAECADCRAELDALRLTVQAVAGLPVQQPRSLFAERVKAQLREAPAAATPGIVTLLWARALPVAAMLVVVVGLVLVVQGQHADRPVADVQVAMNRRQSRTRSAEMAAEAPAGVADEGWLAKEAAAVADVPAEARRTANDYRAASVLQAMNEAAEGDYEDAGAVAEVKDNLRPERERLDDVEAQRLLARPAPGAAAGRGMAMARGAAMGPSAAPAAPEPTEPALTWRDADALPGRAAGVAAREARNSTLDTMAFGARAGGLPADGTLAADDPSTRVVFLIGDDVADLAARTMVVVNRRNLAADVSFGNDLTGGTVDIQVLATPAVCDALAKELMALTGPQADEPKDDDDEGLVVRVKGLSATAGDVLSAAEAERGAPSRAMSKVAGGGRTAARARAPNAKAEERASAEAPARQVALLVRIFRTGVVVLDQIPVRAASAAAMAPADARADAQAKAAGE